MTEANEPTSDQSGAEPSSDSAPESEPERPSHPIFDRIGQGPRDAAGAIAERHIIAGQAAGFFDDLPGHGKPIADLDRPRRTGWWAESFVAKERSASKREDVEAQVRRAMPGLWRLDDDAAVRARVGELNAIIAEYNRVTSIEPLELLQADETVATWRRLRSQ